MSLTEAIQVLVDCASRWAENAEEAFPRRITAADTDEALRELALQSGEPLDAAIEIRDLWKAVVIAVAHLDRPIEGAPR